MNGLRLNTWAKHSLWAKYTRKDNWIAYWHNTRKISKLIAKDFCKKNNESNVDLLLLILEALVSDITKGF